MPPDDPLDFAVNRIKGGKTSSLSDLTKRITDLGFEIASTTGGRHNPGSLHPLGRAADIRIAGKTPQQIGTLMSILKTAGYDVIDERHRLPNEKVWGGPHIHVQFGGKGGPATLQDAQDPLDAAMSAIKPKATATPVDPLDAAVAAIKKQPKPLSKADQRSAYYEKATAAHQQSDVTRATKAFNDFAKGVEDIGGGQWRFFDPVTDKMRFFNSFDEMKGALQKHPIGSIYLSQIAHDDPIRMKANAMMLQQGLTPEKMQALRKKVLAEGNPFVGSSFRGTKQAFAKGSAEILDFFAGVGKAASRATFGAYGDHGYEALQEASREMKTHVEQADEADQMPWLQRQYSDVAGGVIGSAPAIILMELGLPASAAFGLDSALKSAGQDATFEQSVKEGLGGAITGELFDMPFLKNLQRLPPSTKAELLKNIGKRMAAVGVGTTAINWVNGHPLKDAFTQGAGASFWAGLGEVRPLGKGRVTLPPPPKAVPEGMRLPAAKFDVPTNVPIPETETPPGPQYQRTRQAIVEPQGATTEIPPEAEPQLEEAKLSQQYPGVMRMSEETARRNLQEMKAEFDRLKGKKSRSPKEKKTMGALKTQIEALEKQQAGELPNVTRETSPTEERTRPRWTTREQLGATPEQLRLMRREQVGTKGQGVRHIPDVQQTTVKVSDPATGDVEVPIWQQLGDERGFLALGDIMQAIDDLRKKYPKFGEAALRAMAISRLEKERGAETPTATMTRDQLINHIQSQNAGQSAGVLAERLSSGNYAPESVPVKSLSAPYIQPEPPKSAGYAKRGGGEPATIVVNEKGEVVAGQHRFKAAQVRGDETVQVWKPAGVELKPQEPFKPAPDWKPEKREAQPGVKVKRAGEPVAPAKPPTTSPAVKAKPTGTTEPGTERYVLGVQKGPGGWHYAVRDTQFPNMPPKTAGPFPSRDAAIARGGAQATRLNKQGEAGFINVGDAFEAVGDFFRGLPKEISKDLYAVTIKTLQSHEAAQAEMGATRSQVFDNTFEAAEVAAQRLPPQILQDIMLTRGKAETPAGQKMQAEATQRLNAVSNPYLKGMVDTMRRTVQEGYDAVHGYATGRGVKVAYRPDYFYGVWDSPRADVDNFLETWRTTERYKKQKAIPTVADGMGYGLKLADSNPFSNMRRELTDIERRQSMKELADHLRTLPNTAKEISKLPFDQLQRLKADGWRPLNDPAFQGLLIEPKYASYLDNVLATNFMNATKPLKAMRETSRLLQKAKFVGSIFHFKNMVKASIAVEVGGPFNPTGYKDALYSAMKGAFDLRKAGIDPLSPEHLEYVKLSGGHTRAMETEGARAFGQELNVMIERALTPRIGEAGAKIGEGVRKASTAIPGLPGFQRWLFNNYIPALKEIKYFRDLASEEKAKGRPLTDFEKIDIVKRNQNFYGEMNERLFGRSAGMTSALRIPFTAPGFGEGNLRTMARAFKEPLEAVGKLRRGEKLTKMDIRSAQFMVQSWMLSALTAQLTTRLLTGSWATPKTIREMFLVNTGEKDKDGAPIYFDTLSYDKDYWTALGFMANATGMPKAWKQYAGVQPTLGKASSEILQRVAGAEAPAMGVVGMVNDLISHRQIFDWRGRPILREGDALHNWKAIGEQAADRFEPIMISTVRQAMSAGLPPAKSIIYSTMGVRPVRMPGIFQLAHDFNVDSGHPPTGVFEESAYQGLTESLGKPEAQAAFEELHKSKSRGQILKYYKDRTTRPLTGNKEREEKFKQSLTPDQLQWYEEEYAKRRRDLQQIEQIIELKAPAPKPKPQTAKRPSIYQTP